MLYFWSRWLLVAFTAAVGLPDDMSLTYSSTMDRSQSMRRALADDSEVE